MKRQITESDEFDGIEEATSRALARSEIVEAVLAEHLAAVESYQRGDKSALELLVGQVLERAEGRIEPETAREMVRERLSPLEPDGTPRAIDK